MTIEILATYAIALLLVIGTIFTLVAAIGLLKLNDPMTRLHAPTKAGTVGIGAFLMASILQSYIFGEGSFHELLIMAFLFVTAPVSANFMAKVSLHRGACALPPPTPQDETWSTLNRFDHDGEVEEMAPENKPRPL